MLMAKTIHILELGKGVDCDNTVNTVYIFNNPNGVEIPDDILENSKVMAEFEGISKCSDDFIKEDLEEDEDYRDNLCYHNGNDFVDNDIYLGVIINSLGDAMQEDLDLILNSMKEQGCELLETKEYPNDELDKIIWETYAVDGVECFY